MKTLRIFKRDVLVSIKPHYVEKILTGQKTVELRRKFPNTDVIGAKAFIYCSSPIQSVVGFATIEDVKVFHVSTIWNRFSDAACVSRHEFDTYFSGVDNGFVILLKDVFVFENPIHAIDLREEFGLTPPQSYRYVKEEHGFIWDDERLQGPDRYAYNNWAGR